MLRFQSMNGGPLNRRGLTVRQAKFARHYIATNGNGSEAARLAGFSNSSPNVSRVAASQTLIRPNVQKELHRLMSKSLNADEILAGLTEVANSTPIIKGSDKMKAYELLGKNLKMFTDKIETSSPQDEVKSQIIQEVAQRFGLPLDRAIVVVSEVYGDSDPILPVEELVSEAIS